jgi:sugar lactone lactonase YvrE
VTTEVAVAARDAVGEGPHWDAERGVLLRVDIRGEQVIEWSAGSGAETRTDAGGAVSLVVPAAGGGLVVAGGSTVARWLPDGGRVEICRIDPDTPSTTANDGKCDQRGRLWLGTWDRDGGRLGTLSVVEPDGSVRLAESGLGSSNGLAWNADSTVFYLVDTPRRVIWRYPFDLGAGTLGAREVFAEIAEGTGMPDGLATDTAGGVWVALWGGGAVRRYDADGTLTDVVPMPVTYPTSVAFGGEALRTLFVTSSSAHLDEPQAGSVFALRPEVSGVPVGVYGGTPDDGEEPEPA